MSLVTAYVLVINTGSIFRERIRNYTMDTNLAGYFVAEPKLVFVQASCTSLGSTSIFLKFFQRFSFFQSISF